MKIVLAGPPNSGKSTLRVALRNCVQQLTKDRPAFYFINANPDGEGSYTMEMYKHDPTEAKRLRDTYKRGYTPEFIEQTKSWVANCTAPLVGIDIGGRPSQENQIICGPATHAILIAGDMPDEPWDTRLPAWRKFCQDAGLQILAELHSDYDAVLDQVQDSDTTGIFRASIHHLDRRDPADGRPAVIALAKFILDKLRQSTESLTMVPPVPLSIDPARFSDAVEYAALCHASQSRKGTSIPYLAHLLSVAAIVMDIGADEDTCIAALLHDVAEDHGGFARLADVRQRFGERVAQLIEECSDTLEFPKPPWKTRKLEFLQHLPFLTSDAQLIVAADKLHNLRSLYRDLLLHGAGFWQSFKGGREGTLWFYRECSYRLSSAVPASLAAELSAAFVALESWTAE